MNLTEYLRKLSYAELSNLEVGNDGNGSIPPNDVPQIVNYINEGLLRLYSRFILKTNTLIVECNEYRTRYHLSSKHSWLNATEEDKKDPEFSDKFIRDDPEHPYTDDLIKILTVYDTYHHKVPLNNHTDFRSVFTPVFDILEIPQPLTGLAYSVVYQAKHPLLDFEKDPLQEINLPDTLYEALGAYIAYKYYGNLNTQEAITNSQKYLTIYNQVIQDTIEQDLVSSSYSETNSKFHKRGWI